MRTDISSVFRVLFGVMLLQSRRFIEYFPPFALILAAFAWTPLLEAWLAQRRQVDSPPLGRFKTVFLALLAIALLLAGSIFTGQAARNSIRSAKPYTLFQGASAWLVANTPAGARISSK